MDPVHHSQAEREVEIEPHCLADDLGREAIPGKAGAGGEGGHPTDHLVAGHSSKLAAGQVDCAKYTRRL